MGLLYARKQLSIAGIIYIGQTLVGFGTGWTAPIITKLQDPEESPLNNMITDTTISWIESLLYIGCIFGPYISGYFSNIIGRKPCLLLGGIITAFSFGLVIVTRNLTMVFATRIFMGFGIGVIFVGNIVYLGEIATTRIRGILLTATGIASALGTFVIYAVGPYVSYAGTGWLGLGISLMYVGAVLFIPESPIFHIIKGNEDEAKIILINLGRDDEVEQVLATKVEKDQKRNAAQWKELFTMKSNRKSLFMLLILGIFQQMSGIMAMIYFTTTIFDATNSSVTPHIARIIIGATQLVSSCITPIFVEWVGRKALLLLSTSVCCMCLAVLGAYLFFFENVYAFTGDIGWLPLAALMNFCTFYGYGFGIIPSTLTGEMFRSNVRSTGSAVVSSAAWLVGFGVSSAVGYMVLVGSYFPFWLFAGSCASAAVFTAFFVPETKGKSLIEIQEMLEK